MSNVIVKEKNILIIALMIFLSFSFSSRHAADTMLSAKTDTSLVYLVSPNETKNIKLADLIAVTSLKLSNNNNRIVSFRITFDRPGASSMTEFVNNGSRFEPNVLSYIKNAQVKDFITIEDIKGFTKDGHLVKFTPKIINVVE